MFNKNDIKNIIDMINDANMKGRSSDYIVDLKKRIIVLEGLKLSKKYYNQLDKMCKDTSYNGAYSKSTN